MNDAPRSGEVEALIREIHRYLAILEALRAIGGGRRPNEPPAK